VLTVAANSYDYDSTEGLFYIRMVSQLHEQCIDAIRELVSGYLQSAIQDRDAHVAAFAKQIGKTGRSFIHSRQRSQSYQPLPPRQSDPESHGNTGSPSDTEHLENAVAAGYSPGFSWTYRNAANPGVVVEVAHTETTEHLMFKADRYIRAYDVKVVVCLFLAHRSEDTQDKASSVVLKVWTIDGEITSQGGRVPKLIVNKACVPGHLHNNG